MARRGPALARRGAIESKRPNLIGYWKLNELTGATVAHAEVGSDGTYSAPVLLQQPGYGDGGYSIDATANGSQIQVPYFAALGVAHVSLDAWVYPTGDMTSPGRIVSKFQNYEMRLFDAGPYRLQMEVNIGGSFFALTSNSNAIPQNQWSRLTATYDGTSQRLYLNSALIKGPTAAGGGGALHDDVNEPLEIGYFDQDGRSFQGRIDDVKIFGRALFL